MARQAGSPENREAIRAFVERRAPDFRQFRAPSAAAPEPPPGDAETAPAELARDRSGG